MSLLEAFAAIGQRIDHSDVIKFVRDNFIGNNPSNPDWIRRQTQEQRLRLYDDAYDQDINSIVDIVFETKQAREQRRKLRALAKPMNITARIIDEYSYTRFDNTSNEPLVEYLRQRAWQSVVGPSTLFDYATRFLVERRILLPGRLSLMGFGLGSTAGRETRAPNRLRTLRP